MSTSLWSKLFSPLDVIHPRSRIIPLYISLAVCQEHYNRIIVGVQWLSNEAVMVTTFPDIDNSCMNKAIIDFVHIKQFVREKKKYKA